jgi:RNA polymerase sigma factor (sigma-70 family)
MPLAVDPQIVARARSGGDALEPLIAAIWPEAYRLSLSVLRDRGLAEDSAQEACAAIARSLRSLKSGDAFASWSYRIIVNSALAVARRRKRAEMPASAEPAVTFERSDAIDLYTAMAALEPLQRAIVLLHYYAGFNSAEIAASTRLPSSTVRLYLMCARRALRKALEPVQTHSNQEAVSDVH